MATKKKIEISIMEHRGKRVYMFCFDYDQELISLLKSSRFKFTFSKTYLGWWIAVADGLLDEILNDLGEKIEFIKAWERSKNTDLTLVEKKKAKTKEDLVPKEYKDLLKRRRYSENTYRVYVSFFNEYLHFIAPLSANKANEEDIRKYQDFLVNKKKVAQSSQNQAINAIKFYYEKLLGHDKKTYYIERPRKEKKLPIVLSEGEILNILKHTENMKHRLLFALLYATGLRIGELINLRISDVDLERQTVNVTQGKGKKDRMTILSADLIPVITAYLNQYKPNYWFVEGPNRKQYTAGSVRVSLHKSAERAGITKNVTPHVLRHSFATHLHEQGTDIRNVQELLGHNSPETTMIYTYVSKRSLQKIKSPLDTILRSKLLDE